MYEIQFSLCRIKGDSTMKKIDCLMEPVSHFAVGMILLLASFGLTIIGLTTLPVFGLLLAVPVFFFAVLFFTAPHSRECTLS